MRSLPRYWTQESVALLGSLDSRPQGLTSPEAATRLAEVGPNTVHIRRDMPPLQLFLNQFKSPIMLILLFATGVSALLGDWLDVSIVLGIVVVSAGLSFYQEYNAGNAAARLLQRVQLMSTVLRDGKAVEIPADQVVPGDVVQLTAGTLIPADAILLEANNLLVNQAILTGETFPVEKQPGPVTADGLTERINTVFMGTNVTSGSGRGLIVETGKASAFGQIAARLELRPPETEFEHGIHQLGFLISEVMFVLVIVIFAVNVYFQKPVIESLLFSVALAVGLTPQLLPAVINITLSRGAQKMASKGVIVRRLTAIENFGSMDVLCTDKTGTLTQGVVDLDGALDAEGQPSDEIFQLAYLDAIFQSGLPNPLDEAIKAHRTLDISRFTRVDEIPYDFSRKRLSIVVAEAESHTLITKGALESVLSVCTQVGSAALDESRLNGIKQRFTAWSEQGYRVLGVASRQVSRQPERFTRADERELNFQGFLLFLDPPKSDAQEALRELAALGVDLKVITGDNRLAAAHAAASIGMVPGRILTGSEITAMHDEALWVAAEQAALFAEVDPNQKERIILALKKTGHVVGYMGDGINDAPALHAADVGISVDTAVDVAKEAADFVLLKHDLGVLAQGVIEGRKTFANTLKYVFMATSANFGNMFSVAGASLFLPFIPLLPKQILLLNFLTDLPELTIAGDRVDDSAVRKPRRWNVGFIRRFMLVFGSLSSAFDFLTFGVLIGVLHADESLFQTGWFIESLFSAMLVVFVLRTKEPFWSSRPSRGLLLVTAGVAGMVLLLPYSPLAGALGFSAPSPFELLTMLGIAFGMFITTEMVKHWFYRREERLANRPR